MQYFNFYLVRTNSYINLSQLKIYRVENLSEK